MKDSSYHLIARILDSMVWGGELIGEENLPEEGPAVFIANHLGPLGPIGAICSIPFRLYPWVVGEMVDPSLAPDYIRIDFVEPRLKLKPPISRFVSKALTKLTVPLIRSIDGIPTYYLGNQELLYSTLEKSLEVMIEGKFLLVFPEYAILGSDSMKKIYPFQKTVFRLGEMYYAATRNKLGFYPVTIHESRKVFIGSPYHFSPISNLVKERLRLKRLLESAINKQYLELDRVFQAEELMTPTSN